MPLRVQQSHRESSPGGEGGLPNSISDNLEKHIISPAILISPGFLFSSFPYQGPVGRERESVCVHVCVCMCVYLGPKRKMTTQSSNTTRTTHLQQHPFPTKREGGLVSRRMEILLLLLWNRQSNESSPRAAFCSLGDGSCFLGQKPCFRQEILLALPLLLVFLTTCISS